VASGSHVEDPLQSLSEPEIKIAQNKKRIPQARKVSDCVNPAKKKGSPGHESGEIISSAYVSAARGKHRIPAKRKVAPA
jgi:hypothetical protein